VTCLARLILATARLVGARMFYAYYKKERARAIPTTYTLIGEFATQADAQDCVDDYNNTHGFNPMHGYHYAVVRKVRAPARDTTNHPDYWNG